MAHRNLVCLCLALATFQFKFAEGQLGLASQTVTSFSYTLTWPNPVSVSEIVVTRIDTNTQTDDSPFAVGPDPIRDFTVYHLYPSTNYSIRVMNTSAYSAVFTRQTLGTANGISLAATNTPGMMAISVPNFSLPPGSTASMVQLADPINNRFPVQESKDVAGVEVVTFSSLTPGTLYQYELRIQPSSGQYIVDSIAQIRNAPRPPGSFSFSNRQVSSITITVTPSTQPNRVDYYKVTYTERSNQSSASARTAGNAVTLIGLNPNSPYDVTVTSVAGLGSDLEESSSISKAFTLSTAPDFKHFPQILLHL